MDSLRRRIWNFVVHNVLFLYELAKNMDIYQKVQQEIDEVTARQNGEITTELIRSIQLENITITWYTLHLSRPKALQTESRSLA